MAIHNLMSMVIDIPSDCFWQVLILCCVVFVFLSVLYLILFLPQWIHDCVPYQALQDAHLSFRARSSYFFYHCHPPFRQETPEHQIYANFLLLPYCFLDLQVIWSFFISCLPFVFCLYDMTNAAKICLGTSPLSPSLWNCSTMTFCFSCI